MTSLSLTSGPVIRITSLTSGQQGHMTRKRHRGHMTGETSSTAGHKIKGASLTGSQWDHVIKGTWLKGGQWDHVIKGTSLTGGQWDHVIKGTSLTAVSETTWSREHGWRAVSETLMVHSFWVRGTMPLVKCTLKLTMFISNCRHYLVGNKTYHQTRYA